MHCKHARTAIVERELGLLGADDLEVLGLHLRSCPACSAAAADERRIVSELASLRGEIPFELDVTPRVMAGIASPWIPFAPDFTARQFGWCALVAVTAAVALVVTGWSLAPILETIVREAGSITTGFSGLVERIGALALGLLSIPFKLLGALIRSAAALAPMLQRLQPLATGMATFAMLVMMTTIAYFVGRDLLRPDPVSMARSETR